jgi:hypothetical protein
MSDKSRAKLILERWLINIKREDRKHDKMPGIFDSLAAQLFAAGIEFDAAYDLVKTGSKMMYPATETVKIVYNRSKKRSSLQEFTKTWQESLDKSALEAFYTYYDIEGIDPTKIAPTKKVSVVKTEEPGGMVTEDELNEEDFWKSTKSVSRAKPWLFDDEEVAQ